MKIFTRILSGLLFLTLSVTASAATSSAALTDLQKKLASINTIKADFKQTVTHSYKDRTRVESQHSGKIWLSKPNRFRWETAAPDNQLIVADGKMIWVFDRDLEQVTVQDLKHQLQDVPLLVVSGNGDALAKTYKVEKVADGRFNLQAIDKSSMIRELVITFNDSTLASLDVKDSTGANTKISFQNSTQNGALASSLFKFTVPKGVDVIGKDH